MGDFNEMLQKYVDMEYEELVGVAKLALPDVLKACRAVDAEHDGLLMLASILLSALGADKKLSAKERRFLQDAVNLQGEGIDKLVGLYDSQMEYITDRFVDTMPNEIATSTTILVLCLLACDGVISVEENAFIRKLIAKS
ncbi:MAG: hypothetical protein IKK83_01710 [Clostridia bacterium]|nr:hypothetical protein [Clostridia bacterium]